MFLKYPNWEMFGKKRAETLAESVGVHQKLES